MSPPLRTLLARVWHPIRLASREFLAIRGFQHAAAISYFATLSLLPFLALVVAAFGFGVALLGPRHGSEEQILDMIRRALEDFAPFVVDEISERLRGIVQARDAIGLVGALFLFLAASLVFEALETALRDLFGKEGKPRFLLSRLFFFLFFAGLAVLAVIVHMVLGIAGSWVDAVGQAATIELFGRWRLVDAGVSFATIVGGFAIVVSYFVRIRMRPLALFGGSLIFFLLFELSRAVFGAYIEHFARFDMVYGSLATIMIGFVWIYYGSVIFLLSAAFVKALDADLREGAVVGPDAAAGSAGAEEIGADADDGGALLDGDLEVAAHAHAQVPEEGTEGRDPPG